MDYLLNQSKPAKQSTVFIPLVVVMMFSLGCTKGTPTFENLDNSTLPQPKLSGQTSKNVLTTSAGATSDISGECDPKIQDILATVVGVANSSSVGLSSIATSVLVKCSNSGTFSFTLKSLTNLGVTLVENKTYVIELRGVTIAGVSRPSQLNLLYAPTGGSGPKRFVLTSGGTESTSTGPRIATSTLYQAEVRIDHRSNFVADPTAERAAVIQKTSTNYRMKIGSAASAD